MVFATIEISCGPETVFTDLTANGWTCPAYPELAHHLDILFSMSRYAPSAGDPVYAAALAAARTMNGSITFIRERQSKVDEPMAMLAVRPGS
jgi:hypothetical protein